MNKLADLRKKIIQSPIQEVTGEIVNLKLNGAVGIIELNSPKTLNALSSEIINFLCLYLQ